MIQVMKSKNFLQESGMSQTVKQQMVNTNKVIQLNLKALNQVFVIILCDNYSYISENLWQFKRDEVPASNVDLTINNSQ